MKLKQFSFLLLFLVMGNMAALAQQPEIKFQEFDLDNGLHVILHQDKTVPVVVVSVLYHVGSKNEKPERTGFAHFFEHLLFEGTENIKRGEFDKYVAQAGGYNNAYTTQDRTYYYELFPSNQLEMGLWLESERMLHAKILQEGVDTQREVVKEEKRQRYDNSPYGSVVPNAFSNAYKKHPYRWTPIGSMDHLNAATLDEFMEFYRTFYVPNNAVLTLAGNFDTKEAKALVEKYFSEIPKGKHKIERPNIVEPPLEKEVRQTVYDNIQLPAAIHIFRSPAMNTQDYYAFNMLTTLLTSGRSSRMYKSLVDKKQLAVQTAAFPFPLIDPGVAISFGIVNMGVKIEDLESAMDEEYKKVREELISEKEFQKLQNQFENKIVGGSTSMESVAEALSTSYMHFGNTNLPNEQLSKYLKVTREDIQRVAKKYLHKNNRVTLTYLPKKDQKQGK